MNGRPAWMDQGACIGAPADVFFPSSGQHHVAAEAKRYCASCPVVTQCLAHALEHAEQGVWGGLSENERKRVRGELAARPCGLEDCDGELPPDAHRNQRYCSQGCAHKAANRRYEARSREARRAGRHTTSRHERRLRARAAQASEGAAA